MSLQPLEPVASPVPGILGDWHTHSLLTDNLDSLPHRFENSMTFWGQKHFGIVTWVANVRKK